MPAPLTLDPETHQFVDELVRDGRYASPAEAVAAAMARLRLDPADRLDADDWAVIAKSEAEIACGRVRDFSDAAGELRRKRGR